MLSEKTVPKVRTVCIYVISVKRIKNNNCLREDTQETGNIAPEKNRVTGGQSKKAVFTRYSFIFLEFLKHVFV